MRFEIIQNKVFPVKKVREPYRDKTDLITIFGKVCEVIDSRQIASFLVTTDEGVISTVLDFKYDFTSVMPELLDLLIFFDRKEEKEFVLYMYEIDLKIAFLFDNENTTDSRIVIRKSNGQLIKEYWCKTDDIHKSVQETLEAFEKILNCFFPVAYKLFKEENYLLI
ncbi:hypothetical protein QNI19_12345 [Cytophagaceae bacterium DM2B3-1]|uniref:Uncharacterized protein n=1 Tax=Xanthocytophaga flava TaxID=3048013 RepID=A0ABT7CJ16_9BACT|nr:hypothetical protein [Xanthocytophaga flavus]MDJ1467644.1 hypothetical protein [Xanthocytophaga flavus]MDJ1493724.1 hypothetical protein [Xanthocytophaga flavus]